MGVVPKGVVAGKLLACGFAEPEATAGGGGREENGLKGLLEEDMVGVRVGLAVFVGGGYGAGDGIDEVVDLRFFFLRERPRKPILEADCCGVRWMEWERCASCREGMVSKVLFKSLGTW